MTTITRTLIAEEDRLTHTASLFGHHFPLHFEPLVYVTADSLSSDYRGGYWDFFELSNSGFYMAPSGDPTFNVRCENGFEGELSADAFGVTACLYGFSRLSFSGMLIADACAGQYHRLWEYALGHAEVEGILGACD